MLVRDAPEAIAQIASNMTHLTRGMEAWRRWAPAQNWNRPPIHTKTPAQGCAIRGTDACAEGTAKVQQTLGKGLGSWRLANHGRWSQSEHYHARFAGGSVGDYLVTMGGG